MSFEDDWTWQARFTSHASEIVRSYVRRRFEILLEEASPEEDWKRNTDGFVRWASPLPDNARLSRRVRRIGYRASYQYEQTIRVDRPSGREAELPKLIRGYGDIELYGFGPDDGLGDDGPPLRFTQWFLGDLNILRGYLAEGGYLPSPRRNKDYSSRLTWIDLRDLPEGYVLASEELPALEHDQDEWFSCRNPNWSCQDPEHKAARWTGEEARLRCPHAGDHWRLRHGMCAGNYAVETGSRMRRCLCCGFIWRSGWESAAQQLRSERSERIRRLLYPPTEETGQQ